MAGKGGGAWKVAYADFVTAMMAFFMVMWLTAQNDAVKEAVAEHFREPDSLSMLSFNKGKHESGRDRERKPPRHPDEDKLAKSRTARVLVMREGQQPGVASVVPFAPNSAELSESAEQFLADFAMQVKGKPQKIEVRGHTSRRPLPPDCGFSTSWELSYARANAVMSFLVAKGIDGNRIRLSQAGANEPVIDNTGNPKDLERNERVEVYMLGEF